ncbi:MAG: hypothetical protein M1818_001327 [Claussenomyces sp. TS43310]|nr:MAG: hypothetical protein M1818_001327 [Claussenomyces sp. TS43310]
MESGITPSGDCTDLEYWKQVLAGVEPCHFPILNDGWEKKEVTESQTINVVQSRRLRDICREREISLSTVFEVAWGLILQCYIGAEVVCFGSQGDTGELHICHLDLSREVSLSQTLKTAQDVRMEDSRHGHCTATEIKESLDLRGQNLFNTILHHRNANLEPSHAGLDREPSRSSDGTRQLCPRFGAESHGGSEEWNRSTVINVDIEVSENSISVSLDYCLSHLSKGQALNVASTLEAALACVVNSIDQPVGELDLFSEYHKQQVNGWKRDEPECSDVCVHERILEWTRRQPGRPAVSAWDEQWTYEQVDDLSSQLAGHLRNLGLESGAMVPLIFEKTGWVIIAMIAVLKTGSAIVPLDPRHPPLRLKEIIDMVRPRLILCSSLLSELFEGSSVPVITVDRSLFEEFPQKTSNWVPISATSNDLAHILFTSGSTGKPKGVMMNHRAATSSYDNWAKSLNIKADTRALQAASYSHGLGLVEVLGTLTQGGCVCIPDNHDLQNRMAEVINEMGVTWTVLTPSRIRHIAPTAIPSLDYLVLAGEPPSKEDITRWSNTVKLYVLWAATEVLYISVNQNVGKFQDPRNVGPSKGICRLVDPDNHDRQVPIGAVGEMVIQSPTLADGYLNDPEKTAEDFLDRPDWVDGYGPNHDVRFFKVGDLVRYNSDGTLVFIGRKDAVVKLRGQRFGLGEIEEVVGANGDVDRAIVILPISGVYAGRLVAVVALRESILPVASGSEILSLLTGDNLKIAAKWVSVFREELSRQLPVYMIPTAWILVNRIPLTISKKIDRVRTRGMVEGMDSQTSEQVAGLGVQMERPQNAMEEFLARIWSSVLNYPLDKIGRNVSFWSLGGDSITAMVVAARCRDEDITLYTQDVVRYGTISELALHAVLVKVAVHDTAAAEIQLNESRRMIRERLPQTFQDSGDVEDAYPCSPSQQGMLLSKSRGTGDYEVTEIFQVVSESPFDSLGVKKLEGAWRQVVARHPCLRTVFVENASGTGSFDQVVFTNPSTSINVTVETGVDVKSADEALSMLERYRPPIDRSARHLHHLTLVLTTSDEVFGKLSIDHTITDGFSMSLLMRDLSLAYSGHLEEKSRPVYSDYVRFLYERTPASSLEYWKAYLKGINTCAFPTLVDSALPNRKDRELGSVVIEIPSSTTLRAFCQNQNITLSNLFQTAWALVLRAYTGSNDVCFGYMTSGRDLPLKNIQETVGPFINMLVCRMNMSPNDVVSQLLLRAKDDFAGSLAHQHCSLAQIQHSLDLSGQPLFNTSMTVLREPYLLDNGEIGIRFNRIESTSPTEYDIGVRVDILRSEVKAELQYWTNFISDEHAHNVANTFSQAVRKIIEEPNQETYGLDLVSVYHQDQIRRWNQRCPAAMNKCLHDLVTDTAMRRLDCIAVEAWDGNLNYGELESCACWIASQLSRMGIRSGAPVLLCFEKSVWTVVAMLGTLKAGGTCVFIDASHPMKRVEAVVAQTGANHAITSPSRRGFVDKFKSVTQVFTLNAELLRSIKQSTTSSSGYMLSSVHPHNAAFVLFTSGSTGTPKGIVLDHSALSTAFTAQGIRMGIDASWRLLHFSSYAFDVSIFEIFVTLLHGACLCIPSEDDLKNRLDLSISRMNVNCACLVPTVVSLLKPEKVPSLKYLFVGGEPVTKQILADWPPRVKLAVMYGPAEFGVTSTMVTDVTPASHPGNVGRAVGTRAWIVDPASHDRLLPIGCVGELLLEGPISARGYLNDPERTAQTWIKNPAWARHESVNGPRRFYKTGDLARYAGDGQIILLGRIDNQIKLRGQRIELEEIEHQLKLFLDPWGVVKSAVIYAKSGGNGFLVAFILQREDIREDDPNNIVLEISRESKRMIMATEQSLADSLPSYMVPTLYVPVRSMPLLSSGKIDRRRLTHVASGLSAAQVAQYSLVDSQELKRKPVSIMERRLQALWAGVLGLDVQSLGLDDNFFRRGGDSVLAMRLAATSREAGITLSVSRIFGNPRLVDMASVATWMSEKVLASLEVQYNISSDLIQDIYPCTPLQEGIMASAVRQPGAYVSQNIFPLADGIDLSMFRLAWELVSTKCDILRTTIADIGETDGFLQVVLKSRLVWRTATSLEAYLREDKKIPVRGGQILNRYAIVDDDGQGSSYMVWTSHQAVIDRSSVSQILQRVTDAYKSRGTCSVPTDTPSYRRFVEHVKQANTSEARLFWKSQLAGTTISSFPKPQSTSDTPLGNKFLRNKIRLPRQRTESNVSSATIIRAAWALLLAQYSDSKDAVVLGMTLDGRDTSIPRVAEIIGPTIATVPVKVAIKPQATISEFLEELRLQADAIRPYQHLGIQNIKCLSPDASLACDFHSLLAIHTDDDIQNPAVFNLEKSVIGDMASSYLLLLDCRLNKESIYITARYDERALTNFQMKRMLEQLEHIVHQLMSGAQDKRTLKDVTLLSDGDVNDIRRWNQKLLPRSRTCVHDIFSQNVVMQPDAPAICSWDRDFTYRELDETSTLLANYLGRDLGVGAETLVPICFSKSAWAVVAVLAILKAGGGYVPMDPSHPEARLREIVEQAKASIVLCSPEHEALCQSLASDSFAVSQATLDSIKPHKHGNRMLATPDSVAYVMFTSGSTGKPKGVMIEHGAFCTAATVHGQLTNLHSQSRVIHFASYAFDTSVFEILTTLINGGCICVPREGMRMEDIAAAIRDLNVNWFACTPSLVRTIKPEQVPGLKTLVLGGEALGADNIQLWADKLILANGYGPAECCILSCVNERFSKGDSHDIIGRASGGVCWIVDPEDHQILVPVGCVGELVVEGPTLGRGYLNDPAKTAQSFVENPNWLFNEVQKNGVAKVDDPKVNGEHHIQPRSQRVYKTGDLVRYDTRGHADGTIRFVGRKDTQVKVRGQRVELGDIEHHLKSLCAGIKQVTVEQVELTGRTISVLTAFYSVLDQSESDSQSNSPGLFESISDDWKNILLELQTSLANKLPSYMLPTLYIPVSRMPLQSSGKTNRNELRRLASVLSDSQIAHYSLSVQNKRKPSNQREIQMQLLWAKALRLGGSSIGADDNFFRLGGDSITAMKLASFAREEGLLLSVADIFTHPRLCDMATIIKLLELRDQSDIEPFSLLRKSDSVEALLNRLLDQYEIAAAQVEDSFPCTPLQEGLMLLSVKQSAGSYMSQCILTLRPTVSLDRFNDAWQKTIKRNSIMRTRIVPVGDTSVQTIVRGAIEWRRESNLETYIQRDKRTPMDYGSPLARYGMVSTDESHTFILTLHHSLYDGLSLPSIFQEVEQRYKDQASSFPPVPSYARFVQYIRSIDTAAAKDYWLSQLSKPELSTFPDLASSPSEVTEETVLVQKTQVLRPSGSDITLSTLIRAAWAMVTAKYAESDDVFFGAMLMGRNASLPSIERITGPTITTVPIAVSINREKTIQEFLYDVQSQAIEMMPFEHTGLQNIKRFSQETERACNFQNLLVVQPAGTAELNSEIWQENELTVRGELVSLTYALILECRISEGGYVRSSVNYRQNVISGIQMKRMLDQFQNVLHQLNSSSPDQLIGNVEFISAEDKREIGRWHDAISMRATSDTCIHDFISRRVAAQPDKDAVCAWDGKLTYRELDRISTIFARSLQSIGVGPEHLVPLCFDKSAWAVVAMLAVLKAGGAYVSLDPKHPMIRKEHIIKTISADVLLVGHEHEGMFKHLPLAKLVISQASLARLPKTTELLPAQVRANNTAFMIFTSGSTGVPKGILMEHGAFSTSAKEHSKALKIGSSSRVLQFAAYTYDVSVGEILTTLMQGGCICVPSEADRMSNLASSIRTLNADWAFLTPTVASLVHPGDVPNLKTLVLGGEHATAENFRTWATKLNLINSYGPAECAIWCSCYPVPGMDADPATLGNSIGVFLWVADAGDHNKLTPVGCVGELLVEGPILARGYLNDDAKTAAAFINTPEWAKDGSDRVRRMYKTGDLVRFNDDGTLSFVGRKDTQIKLRGQRIEIGEIEHQLAQLAPESWFSVVQMLHLQGRESEAALCAFINVHGLQPSELNLGDGILPLTEEFSGELEKLRSHLEDVLPIYMVPTTYILVREIPLTNGGKVDRQALARLAENLTVEQLLPFTVGNVVVRPPSTEMEKKLQGLWAKALGHTPDSIGVDHNFLRIGGDSISAMRLSSLARADGISLSVAQIFRFPKLHEMGKVAAFEITANRSEITYTPFSSLRHTVVAEFLENVISPQISAQTDEIEDVLEATDYQRWVLGCGQLKGRVYHNYFILAMKGDVDHSRLEHSCRELVSQIPILRTVFSRDKNHLWQVILKSYDPEFQHHICKDILYAQTNLIEEDMERPVVLGEPIIRFIMIENGARESRLIMRISHAQYDGICFPILLNNLIAGYLSKEFSTAVPFSKFVHFQQQLNLSDGEAFWRSELLEANITSVLSLSDSSCCNPLNRSLKRVISSPAILSQGITFATLIKAAWSVVLSKLSVVDDVVFGQVVTGRNLPMAGVDEVIGPCLNIMPVRVRIDPSRTAFELLNEVQEQHLLSTPHEWVGFQHIIEKCSDWSSSTRFSSILQHTSFDAGINRSGMMGDIEIQTEGFSPPRDVSDVWIWSGPQDDGFVVDFTFSDRAMSEDVAKEMLDVLCRTVDGLSANSSTVVAEQCPDARRQISLPIVV